MTKKKSKAQRRSQGSSGEPVDPLLAPGVLIVVDGDEVGRNAFGLSVEGVLGPNVRSFRSFDGLQAYIHPHSTGQAGRPPVRGFLLDWGLGKRRGASLPELVSWLDRVYPRTPLVTFAHAPELPEIQRMCADRGHTVVGVKQRPAGDLLRRAAVAVARMPKHPIAVLSRDALSDEVLRRLERERFHPWEVRRLHARSWLIAQRVAETEAKHKLLESDLRTVEAHFECVTAADLPFARGIKGSTRDQLIKRVGDIWPGRTLETLKQLWELDIDGRGASWTPSWPFLDGLDSDAVDASSADETTLHRGPDLPRLPRPRRASARRSR